VGFTLDKSGNGFVPFTIISAPAPSSGAIDLFLYGVADIDGSDLDPEGVDWDDIAILIVDETGELRDSTIFQGRTTRQETQDPELVVRVGTGPRDTIPGAAYWDGEYAGDWSRDGGSTYESLGKLLVRTRLGYRSGRREVRVETYEGLEYEMGDVLDIGGKLFFPIYHEKDLASGEDTFEAIEIGYDDSIITFGERAEDRGRYDISSPTAGVSANEIPAAGAPVIEELGDFIVGGEDGVPERLPIGEGQEDDYFPVTDGEESGGWRLEKYVPLPISTKGDLIVTDGEGEPEVLSIGEGQEDGYVAVTDGEATGGWALQELPSDPITSAGDLIIGDGEGDSIRLPITGNTRRFLIELAGDGEDEKVGWSEYSAPATVISGVFNATDAAGNPKQLTIENGWITNIADPPPLVTSIFYITDPSGTDAELRELTDL